MTTTQENSKKRKRWNVDDKLDIIRKHFNKSKIIETCDEYRVHPNMISSWWKTILEAGKEALSGQTKREQSGKDKMLKNYEIELAKKNEIIAELSQELLELKKNRMVVYRRGSSKS